MSKTSHSQKQSLEDNYELQTSQTHRLNRVEPNIWMSKLQKLQDVKLRMHL